MEPSLEETQHVDDELDGSGWGINWTDGRWHVMEWPDHYYNQDEPRTARGGVTVDGKSYRAGVWVPMQGDVPAADREKMEAAKSQEVRNLIERQQKLSSTPVDRKALQAKVAGADGNFSPVELRSIDYGYRALKRHHGAQVLNRLTQLIDGLVSRSGDVEDPEAKKKLQRRLAAYKIMLDRAESDFPE
jgi:hypothetical protein